MHTAYCQATQEENLLDLIFKTFLILLTQLNSGINSGKNYNHAVYIQFKY